MISRLSQLVLIVLFANLISLTPRAQSVLAQNRKPTTKRTQQTPKESAKPKPDGPATKDEVEEYFAVMHIRENMQAMKDSMAKQSHQMVHEEIQESGASLPADFEERMDKLMDEMTNDFPVENLVEAIVPVFQQHFTRNDLEAITTFYSTPVGQKLLNEQPALTQDSMQVAYGVLEKQMEVMRERVQTEIGQERLSPKPAQSKPSGKPQ
jgi:uncharacterized protein